MQRLSQSVHEAYFVVDTARLLHSGCPNLEEIKLILQKVTARGSNGAKYFLLMLKVLVKDGFLPNEVLSTFQDLFTQRWLTDCKRAIINIESPPSYKGCHWSRFLLPELEYRLVCNSDGTYKGYGRKPRKNLASSRSYDEYSVKNICLFFRLDVKLAWFLIQLCFI